MTGRHFSKMYFRFRPPVGCAAARATPGGLLRRRTELPCGAVVVAAVLALGYFAVERLTGSKLPAPGGASVAVLPLPRKTLLKINK
jgi:hypothetical protein